MRTPVGLVPRAVLSPCIGICQLDAAGSCEGCGRSADQIAGWTLMDDAARLRVMDQLLAHEPPPHRLRRQLPWDLDGIAAALHPLLAVPAGPPWNLDELADLLPGFAPVPAAVLVGLVPRPSGLQVLLTRRTEGLRHHGGQVAFPGGRIDPGDADARAAAIRETGEEIGLPASDLVPMGWLDPMVTVTGFTVLPLVAAITPNYRARPEPGEVAEVFEVPLEFLMAAPNLRRIQLDWRGRPRTVLEFADRGMPAQRIWGATASILFNLRHRLEQT